MRGVVFLIVYRDNDAEETGDFRHKPSFFRDWAERIMPAWTHAVKARMGLAVTAAAKLAG
ncbi:MAG: hypothetical protein NT049_14160, partial [Planctomycetota bacterium]|nr:hypothetical protein [Planctomycetota bacterium]